jgi:AcrR family transcriptional regulator
MCARRIDPELTERRRAELIKAGYEEILENGIQNTTLDAVVTRAGSSKGGALYYFPTKDDLLIAVLEWLLGQLDHSLEDVVRAQGSPRARLASELELLFHSVEINRNLYLVLFDFVTLATRSERFRSPFERFNRRCRERDIAIVEEGIRVRQFRNVKAADAAATIRALVDGYCLGWLMEGATASIEVYRDRARAVLGSFLLRNT